MRTPQRDVSTLPFKRQGQAKSIAFFKELEDIFCHKVDVLRVCMTSNPQPYTSKLVARVKFIQIPFTFD